MVFYGDSISEVGRTPNWFGGATAAERNWGQQLCALLGAAFPACRFVGEHFGIGGQNTYEGLGRLDGLAPLAPELVFVAFGANDCGFHTLAPDETRLALTHLLDGIAARTQADAVVLSSACFNPQSPLYPHVPETIAAQRAVAGEKQVLFVDLQAAVREATGNGARWSEFHNGVQDCHPNDAGHALWARTVLAAVWPHLTA